MARIKVPSTRIYATRNTNKPPFYYFKDVSRAYKRVGNQFQPIGWYVRWSDFREEVILDSDLLLKPGI